MDTSKGSERINEEGAVETKVDTVDYRKGAGQDRDAEPEKVEVEVTHLSRTDDKPGTVAEASGKVAQKLQSAKQAVSSTAKADDDKKTE